MANRLFTSIKARFFPSVSSRAVDIGVNADTEPRIAIDAGGRITWGPGNAPGDAYVQRVAEGAINFVGDVGVNTTAPDHELDVTGTVGTYKVSFDTGTHDLDSDGELAWDDLDQALAYRTGGITVDIAQENLIYVRNASGNSTITKGSAVAVLGADSNRLSVQLCDATAGGAIGCRTVGVAMQDIPSPGFGFVSTFGLLRGFNTGNIIGTAPVAPGAELFISSTPGVLSTDPQPSPGRRVTVGYVITTGTQGSIFVTIRRGLTVDELDNAEVSAPEDGDVLTFESSTGLWTAASVSLVGTLDDLSDVSINNPQEDEVIRYDPATGLWQNASVGSAAISVEPDFPPNPEEGDLWYESTTGSLFVYYDGFWVETGSGSTSVITLAELGDTDIDQPQDGDILRYDDGTWESEAPTFVERAGDTMTGELILPGDPTVNLSAAPKQYADTKVAKTGDTMTGALILPGDPVGTDDAARKAYVDSGDALKVDKAGDTMTGDLRIEAPNPEGLYVGSDSDQVTDTKSIKVQSRGYAGILLDGDTDNVAGESGGAFVKLQQDGGAVRGRVGMINSSGDNAEGGSYSGSLGNSLLVGTDGNYRVQFGTNGTVRASIEGNGQLNLTAGRINSTVGASSHSHGSISVGGQKGSYAGIAFPDANAVFMVRASDALSGVYVNNNTWRWYFDGNGTLAVGTVPLARLQSNTSQPCTPTRLLDDTRNAGGINRTVPTTVGGVATSGATGMFCSVTVVSTGSGGFMDVVPTTVGVSSTSTVNIPAPSGSLGNGFAYVALNASRQYRVYRNVRMRVIIDARGFTFR